VGNARFYIKIKRKKKAPKETAGSRPKQGKEMFGERGGEKNGKRKKRGGGKGRRG